MRNLFLVGLLSIMLVMGASAAIACGGHNEPQCGPRDANFNAAFNAESDDYSYRARGNEQAEAGAYGFSGGNLNVTANADGTHKEIVGWKRVWIFKVPVFGNVDNPADAYGYGEADSESKAWTWTRDYGLTSKAGAGAETNGEAFTFGAATGLKGCPETVDSTVYVGGNVYQSNYAAELGYSNGQGVDGGNMSNGNFYAADHDYESGRGFAADSNYIEGGMITKGKTEVSIDPYGSHRSITGRTENMIQVNAPGTDSMVFGQGGVGGNSANGASFAGGQANFGYNGVTYGNGNANINASVVTSGEHTNVTVSGSAHSVSDGGFCQGSCGKQDPR